MQWKSIGLMCICHINKTCANHLYWMNPITCMMNLTICSVVCGVLSLLYIIYHAKSKLWLLDSHATTSVHSFEMSILGRNVGFCFCLCDSLFYSPGRPEFKMQYNLPYHKFRIDHWFIFITATCMLCTDRYRQIGYI